MLTLANFIGHMRGTRRVRKRGAAPVRWGDADRHRTRWRLHQVDFETGLIGDVRAGKADLGAAGSEAWASVGVNSFRALNAPLLINSYALQDRVLRSPVIGQMLQGLRPLGLVGIGVLPGPLRKPLGISRPLLQAVRLRGAQDRDPAVAGR